MHDRVLFADVFAADATLYEHAGEWWLFMTQAAPGESIDLVGPSTVFCVTESPSTKG